MIRACESDGLDARIVRPSIVGPAWAFPYIGWAGDKPSTIVGAGTLLARRGVRVFRDGFDHPCPVVPVDIVADVTVTLGSDQGLETHWTSTWVHHNALLMYLACFSTLIPDPSWLLKTGRLLLIVITHSDGLAFLVFCTNWDAVGFESPLVFFGTFLIPGKLYVEHTTVTEGRSCMPVLMHRKLTKCHPSSFSRVISISFWRLKAKGNTQPPRNSKGLEMGLMLCTELIWSNVEYFEIVELDCWSEKRL